MSDSAKVERLLPSPEIVGVVASETSTCNELAVATEHCTATNTALMVSSSEALNQVATIRAAGGPPTVVDTRHWHAAVATEAVPTALHDGLPLYDLDEWATAALDASQATAILTPSRFVPLGNRAVLRAVLAATAEITVPNLVTLIATDAAVLGSRYVTDFLDDLAGTPSRPLAFVFADKRTPLASYDRLRGLRALLSRFPGSWILGVDVLTATDALAHGAGWVAMGASSARRWPRRPGDSGGRPLSKGYLPGLFLRSVLDTRSPDVYADWYANSRSPHCDQCHRALDMFEATPTDKPNIIRHNLHAVRDLAAEITAQPAAQRPAWLNHERVEAFLRHASLTSRAAPVEADRTLRALCELDDPQMRETSPAGHWK